MGNGAGLAVRSCPRHGRFLSQAVLACLAIFVWCVTTPQMCDAQSGPREPHIYSKVKRPQSLTDLLENIRLLVDQTFLDRDDFYSEENLGNFFGGDTLRWS